VSATLVGTHICDYVTYRALSIDHSSIVNPYYTSQTTQSITIFTSSKVFQHLTIVKQIGSSRSTLSILIYIRSNNHIYLRSTEHKWIHQALSKSKYSTLNQSTKHNTQIYVVHPHPWATSTNSSSLLTSVNLVTAQSYQNPTLHRIGDLRAPLQILPP
jgi:hypothetical protein